MLVEGGQNLWKGSAISTKIYTLSDMRNFLDKFTDLGLSCCLNLKFKYDELVEIKIARKGTLSLNLGMKNSSNFARI